MFRASTAESKWTIFVSVGAQPEQLKVFMEPEELIDQLKVRVTAHSGFLVGKAFDTNTEELVELLDDQTIKSCLISQTKH